MCLTESKRNVDIFGNYIWSTSLNRGVYSMFYKLCQLNLTDLVAKRFAMLNIPCFL